MNLTCNLKGQGYILFSKVDYVGLHLKKPMLTSLNDEKENPKF